MTAGQVDQTGGRLAQVGHRHRLAGQQPWRFTPDPVERIGKLGKGRPAIGPQRPLAREMQAVSQCKVVEPVDGPTALLRRLTG